MGNWKLVQYRQKKQRGKAASDAAAEPEDWRLYDLESDVGEQNDVAEQHPEVVQRILRVLDRDALR
jgi:hypothetical protein